MNSATSLRTLVAYLLIATLAVGFTACDDDDLDPREATNDRLVGDWDVTSFTIDGEEVLIGGATFEMEYEKDNDDPFEGEFEWDIVEQGASLRIDGEYEVDDAGDELSLSGDDIDDITFDMDLDGDDLELSGTVDGERWDIEAERD